MTLTGSNNSVQQPSRKEMPDCIFCRKSGHWSVDCPELTGPDLEYVDVSGEGRGHYALLRRESVGR